MAVLGGGVSGAKKLRAGGWKPCLYLQSQPHHLYTYCALYSQINTLFKTHWNKSESAVLIL